MVIADSDYEGPAIQALGSLFKITQIFLWSHSHSHSTRFFLPHQRCYAMLRTHKNGFDLSKPFPSFFDRNDGLQVSVSAERSKSAEVVDNDNEDSNLVPDWSDLLLPEDLELTRKMSELGLPLSFQRNKEKCGSVKGKRKGTKSKHLRTCHNPVYEALYDMNAEEVVSPSKFHDKTSSSLSCISMPGQIELSYYDGAVEVDMTQCASGEGDNSACCTGFANGVSSEKNNDDINEAVTNDAQDGDILVNNICVDLKIAPASDNVVSAGSHLIDKECLEISPVVCKDSEHETIFNDDGTATWANESELLPMNSEGIGCDRIDVSNNCGQLGDWMLFWDTFYMRRYFYNIKTHISTWHPPPGMEHLAIGGCTESDYSEALKAAEECRTQNNTKPPEETLTEENLEGKQHDEYSAEIGVAAGNLISDTTTHSKDQSLDHSDEYLERSSCNDGVSCCSLSNTLDHIISSNERCIEAASEVNDTHLENMVIDISGLDTLSDTFISKQKKKVKRRQRQRKSYNETEGLQFQEIPEEYSATIGKYWRQRYILFSRFDDGIRMDEEGWFSVTPESIARYQAERCASGIIIDCFAGVGGNAIQFAQWCRHVIAIDIDPLKIDYARHNAAIYGVGDQIDFIMGDFFLLAPKLKADTVFLSPPWGGPDYAKVMTYDMKTMLRPHDGYTLFNVAKEIASRVVMFLPRNINFNQLAELSLSACPPWSLEVEKVYVNGKLKAITAYFSNTAVGGC